jgi:colicin import membrane protein
LRQAREAAERNAAAAVERQREVAAKAEELAQDVAREQEAKAAAGAARAAEAKNDAARVEQESKAAKEAQAEADAAAAAEADLMTRVQAVSTQVAEIDVSIEVGTAVESPPETRGSGSLRLVPAELPNTSGGSLSTPPADADEEELKAAARAAKAAKVREAKLRRNAEKQKAAKERLLKAAAGEVSPDAAPIEDLTPKSAWRATAKAVVRNEGLVGASGATRAPAADGPGKLTVIIIEAQGLVVRAAPLFVYRYTSVLPTS